MRYAELTETRKADRAKIEELVTDLATGMGATVSDFIRRDREVTLDIQINGSRLLLDIDGESWQPNTFVNCWNTIDRDLRYDPSAWGCLASVNPFHFGKASIVSEGVDELLGDLEQAIALISDGDAYQEKPLIAA